MWLSFHHKKKWALKKNLENNKQTIWKRNDDAFLDNDPNTLRHALDHPPCKHVVHFFPLKYMCLNLSSWGSHIYLVAAFSEIDNLFKCQHVYNSGWTIGNQNIIRYNRREKRIYVHCRYFIVCFWQIEKKENEINK